MRGRCAKLMRRRSSSALVAMHKAEMSLVSASNAVVTRLGQPELASVPRNLGKYHVLFELGRGGMATVYLAVTQSAPGVNKLVALKSLLPEYAREADACAM